MMTSLCAYVVQGLKVCVPSLAVGVVAQTQTPISHESPITIGVVISGCGIVLGAVVVFFRATGELKESLARLEQKVDDLPCKNGKECGEARK